MACVRGAVLRQKERERDFLLLLLLVEFCLDSLVDKKKKKDPRGKGREGVKGRSIE